MGNGESQNEKLDAFDFCVPPLFRPDLSPFTFPLFPFYL